MQSDLTGRAALVTGAASGIGLATATMLARFGCAEGFQAIAAIDRLGRLDLLVNNAGTSEDIGEVIVFLGAMVTGRMVVIDGGLTL